MADLRQGRRREVRAAGRAGLSAVAGGAQAGGRRRRHAAALLEGELQQRLHRHGRRHLSERRRSSCCSTRAAQGAAARRCSTTRAWPRWKFPFAPHDLGTYPLANGQVYGGGETHRGEPDAGRGERQHADHGRRRWRRVEGNADFAAEILAAADEVGGVPEGEGARSGEPALHRRLRRPPGAQREPVDQGDPRAGRLRASSPTWPGTKTKRAAYRQAGAGVRAQAGSTMADDGDHYRLAFDKPGTWSQKYNLVWDKLLGLNLFPPEVARKEIAFYLTKQNALRPAARQPQATTPSSTGSSGPRRWPRARRTSRRSWRRCYDFANESPTRVPLTDWYDTRTASSGASRRARWSAASSSRCWRTRRCGRSTPAAYATSGGPWRQAASGRLKAGNHRPLTGESACPTWLAQPGPGRGGILRNEPIC